MHATGYHRRDAEIAALAHALEAHPATCDLPEDLHHPTPWSMALAKCRSHAYALPGISMHRRIGETP